MQSMLAELCRRIKASSTKQPSRHPTATPSSLTPSSHLILSGPCRLLESHSGQAVTSTGPQGTWPKDALPQGPRRLLLPTEASSPTQAARKPSLSYPSSCRTDSTWGVVPSSLPPKRTCLRSSSKCPIPQSQDHHAELMLGGHFLETSRV